jgi:hypothetical protein
MPAPDRTLEYQLIEGPAHSVKVRLRTEANKETGRKAVSETWTIDGGEITDSLKADITAWHLNNCQGAPFVRVEWLDTHGVPIKGEGGRVDAPNTFDIQTEEPTVTTIVDNAQPYRELLAYQKGQLNEAHTAIVEMAGMLKDVLVSQSKAIAAIGSDNSTRTQALIADAYGVAISATQEARDAAVAQAIDAKPEPKESELVALAKEANQALANLPQRGLKVFVKNLISGDSKSGDILNDAIKELTETERNELATKLLTAMQTKG